MTELMVVAALIVAAMYTYIAAGVVPRLGRTPGEGRLMTTARWAAGAFFAGCAVTHLGTAVEMANASGASSATQMAGMGGMAGMAGIAGLESPAAWAMIGQHLIPHIAQIVGGAVFIGIARSRLELSVLPKEDAERLHTKERQFRAAFRQAPTGVGLVSTSGPARNRLVQVNPALAAILGYEAESDLLGRDYLDLVAPSDRAGAEAAHAQLEAGVPVVEFDARLLRRDGSEIWTSVRACMFDESGGGDGGGEGGGGGAHGWPLIVAQVLDITEDRRREAELRHLADHDVLTQLFNRGRFEQELDRVVAAGHQRNDVAALLLVDLDQFKYVNDTYGHGVGDQVLRAVADALRGRLRADDVIGRLGGDEFGILCPSTGPEAARALAQELLRTVHDEAQITVGTRIVRSAASIGVTVICGNRTITSEHLLAEADLAMYEAKRSGCERVWMAEEEGAALTGVRSHLAWSERIREALSEDGFQLWEQPILNLATGECDRSELLIRMIDPVDGSLVPPGLFLTAAERFGQIQAIDRWVFRQAISLLAQRQAAGDRRALEINLSGASLTDEPLIDELADLIRCAPIDPTRLIVEVTETAAVRNVELARHVARRLSDLGCTFALDDFGSGFGSFYYLKHLPFTGLKIDGEFVKDLPMSRSDRLTVEAIVSLGLGLGKEITAEFVQNDETVALLRDLGVHFAQGYHVGHPREVPEFVGRFDREPQSSAGVSLQT